MGDTKADGLKLIAAERKRQIRQEGWTPEHDDEHASGELALVAARYAMPAEVRAAIDREDPALLWPRSWHATWWKPGDRIRELSKAGALIAAEIDRLLRAAGRL